MSYEDKKDLYDMEMQVESSANSHVETDGYNDATVLETKLSLLNRLAAMISAETKGIEPITDDEKNDDSLINAASMWFSANMVLPALAIGGLGPLVFGLNFGVSVLTIVFFNILGLFAVAFFSVFGAKFGLRQMVLSRYLVGNITARIFALINSVACVGWGIVNTVAASQLLNEINPGSHQLPLWGGCLVIIGATILVSFFGYKVIHTYEKYSWVPNFAVFLVLIARLKISGKFHNGAWGSGPTTASSVLSFGSAVFGFASGWTTYAADYTVYMPRNTNSYKIFFALVAGLAFPLFFTMILGSACAQAAVDYTPWQEFYNKNGMGGLTFAILVPDSLHGFGQFCCVVLAMSTIANNVPNMYTIALSAQSVWDPFAKIPRVVWTMIGNLAALGISIPACYYFSTFMQYFMDSIAYYLSIYISIALCEHLIYRHNSFSNYNVEDWNNFKKLPIGIAGTISLVVGAFGVALGMSQSYWVGEIARHIGEYGGDIAIELGAGWAFIAYNICRPLELKYFGR
uniref:Cytosine permease n=1 Tax=Candida glabrata TaxID=5478 RepID=Q0Z9B2_CANGB|nr:cytosine permease [Nakaseomyces glabratus]